MQPEGMGGLVHGISGGRVEKVVRVEKEKVKAVAVLDGLGEINAVEKIVLHGKEQVEDQYEEKNGGNEVRTEEMGVRALTREGGDLRCGTQVGG